jgi:hypothetical protein
MVCDEMTRRIYCRVIRSVPFGKKADALRHSSSANDKPDVITDAVVGEAGINQPGNSMDYTGSPNIPLADDDVIGRNLDCYV